MADKKEATEKPAQKEKPKPQSKTDALVAKKPDTEKTAASAPEPAPEPQPKTDPPVAETQPVTQTTVQAQPKKSNTWLICCGCGCGCAGVVVILIIIFWMFNFFGALGGAGGPAQLFNDWRASTVSSITPNP